MNKVSRDHNTLLTCIAEFGKLEIPKKIKDSTNVADLKGLNIKNELSAIILQAPGVSATKFKSAPYTSVVAKAAAFIEEMAKDDSASKKARTAIRLASL